ncbi:hypothetical protein ESCO_002935 [Escovopsis weberi]|uniref:Uncharacterized protein n=1 Tax=Escovopsis weberi TaxID=150374 RepID=A0A0M9VST9_ESCWE|nr:hypothetical protein ESCO_002935 [Escovopsis weberi]
MALYGQHASAVQPLAYLNMEFEVIKASPTFLDGVRIPHIIGRKFSDLVVPSQVGVVHTLQAHVINEQRSREPNYLPPIMGSGLADSVIQQLGYGVDDATRFPLLHQEYFSFIGSDTMTRTLPVRLGLAKGESHYFVVALLNLQPPPAQPQYARDRPVNYHPMSTPPQSIFGEPGSNSSTRDSSRIPQPRDLPGLSRRRHFHEQIIFAFLPAAAHSDPKRSEIASARARGRKK